MAVFPYLAAILALVGVLAAAQNLARAGTASEAKQTETDFIRAHGDVPIAGIRFVGLERTRPAVVSQWIDCAAGEPLSRCDLVAIHERLNRLAIFSAIDVSLAEQPAGVDVVLRFEEKWTLYPVPMIWYFPGTEVVGLILAEANLFGANKGLAVGGIYSNRGWYTIAAYNDPNIAFTSLWGDVHAFMGSGLVEDDAPDGSIEQSFDMARLDVEYSIGLTLWDRLSPTWTGAFRWADVETVHVPGAEPATSATVAVQGVQLIYSDRRYRGFYDEGMRLSAEVQHAFPLDHASPSYDDAILDAKVGFAAPLGGSLEAAAHAFFGAMPVVFEERLGGLDGSRTLPGGGLIAADRYASLTLAYQVPLVSAPVGTLTGVVFGEAGRYVRNSAPTESYGGPGAGLRFYLERVSIPAVGLDVGYEVESHQLGFSVVVGYRPTR